MAREPVWDAFPELRAVGHGLRGLWRNRRLVLAALVATVLVAAFVVPDRRFAVVAFLPALAVVAFMVTRPREFATTIGLRRTRLELMPWNPLGDTLHRAHAWPPPVMLDPAGLERVVVGVTGDGRPWEVNVLGTHILVAGVSGAGKSSVIWSLLDGLGPYIRCGLVQVHAIDPKLGLELTIGRDLFERYEYTSWEAMAKLLDDAVKTMHRRALALAGNTRKHVPTVAEPLLVVLVDEMTVLTEIPDAKVRKQIDGSLFALLAQGRAAGVVVVGAGQDIRKERLPDRHMFPTAIALRMERLQVDMILGDGARDRGAVCDQIPRSLPGTGYVMVDGGDPMRVRSYFLDDDAVRRAAHLYGVAS